MLAFIEFMVSTTLGKIVTQISTELSNIQCHIFWSGCFKIHNIYANFFILEGDKLKILQTSIPKSYLDINSLLEQLYSP